MNGPRPRLAVHGAGRMGRLVAEFARDEGFELAGVVSRHHPGELPGARWYPGLDAPAGGRNGAGPPSGEGLTWRRPERPMITSKAARR